jgi:hypothetical protein
MHPSQIIPATANFTVADRGEGRHALVQRAIVNNNWRLVMVCPRKPESHHKNTNSSPV